MDCLILRRNKSSKVKLSAVGAIGACGSCVLYYVAMLSGTICTLKPLINSRST